MKPQPEAPTSFPRERMSPLRVLIAEDLEDDAKLMLRELNRGGYQVTFERVETAEAFRAALARETWDLVLSDYRMPCLNGLEALELLKQSSLDLPFIIVSGTIGEEVAVNAMKAGVNDYVMKDNLARLCPAIERVFREVEHSRVHKWAEEALVASEKRYRELFDNATDIVYTHDVEGNFISFNRAGERITGYSLDEALGMKVQDLVIPEQRGRLEEMIRQIVSTQEATTGEVAILTKNGGRVSLELSIRKMNRDARPVAVQGIARDISERLQLEEQLRQAQKMEAVGRLAGGVAHDFNNLLTVIKGYSELLLAIETNERVARPSEEIRKAADRAAGLTRQLLAFSRRQVLQPTVLELNELVSSIERMLRRLIGEDIELVTALSPGLGHVKADAGQIEQVLMNLAVNARDAMPGGGKLILETSNVTLDETYCRQIGSITPGSYVMMVVSDTGTGINPAVMDKIFEPFFTTKAIGKGTGLGLSTVYGIIRQSGGSIWVYSEVGHGATFKICLPRVDEAIKPEPLRPAVPSERGCETVLLVEDEEAVRILVKRLLEAHGYTVLDAACGADALRIAAERDTVIHLLLTDVVLPQNNGRELAERMVELRPEIKVLFMSGYTDDSIVHYGVLEADVPFVQKPFTMDALIHKTRETLAAPRTWPKPPM